MPSCRPQCAGSVSLGGPPPSADEADDMQSDRPPVASLKEGLLLLLTCRVSGFSVTAVSEAADSLLSMVERWPPTSSPRCSGAAAWSCCHVLFCSGQQK